MGAYCVVCDYAYYANSIEHVHRCNTEAQPRQGLGYMYTYLACTLGDVHNCIAFASATEVCCATVERLPAANRRMILFVISLLQLFTVSATY